MSATRTAASAALESGAGCLRPRVCRFADRGGNSYSGFRSSRSSPQNPGTKKNRRVRRRHTLRSRGICCTLPQARRGNILRRQCASHQWDISLSVPEVFPRKAPCDTHPPLPPKGGASARNAGSGQGLKSAVLSSETTDSTNISESKAASVSGSASFQRSRG